MCHLACPVATGQTFWQTVPEPKQTATSQEGQRLSDPSLFNYGMNSLIVDFNKSWYRPLTNRDDPRTLYNTHTHIYNHNNNHNNNICIYIWCHSLLHTGDSRSFHARPKTSPSLVAPRGFQEFRCRFADFLGGFVLWFKRTRHTRSPGLMRIGGANQHVRDYPLVIWHSCWTWPFIVDLSIKNCDFP